MDGPCTVFGSRLISLLVDLSFSVGVRSATRACSFVNMATLWPSLPMTRKYSLPVVANSSSLCVSYLPPPTE